MSLLKKLKKSYQKKNTQFIVIDNKGVIIENDNTLFVAELSTPIHDVHPFFLSLNPFEESSYTCVHLDINTTNLICDIELKPINEKYSLIILSDFSKHYNSFQSLAQLRNETAIASEITELKNKALKEREEFKNKFISNFSHEIISPIMSIMTFGNMLNKTKLTIEQEDYINVINTSTYHLKSILVFSS